MNLEGNKEFTEQIEIDKMNSQSICQVTDAFFVSSNSFRITSPRMFSERYPR